MYSTPNESGRTSLSPTQEGARAIAAATMQIDLALREAQEPVELLAASVSSIGLTLVALGATSAVNGNPEKDLSVDMQVDWALSQLQHEIANAIEQLQFYDRMLQHLSHVRDYLLGVGSQLAITAEQTHDSASLVQQQTDPAVWERLRERLFERLISDPQRELLEMMLPATDANRSMNAATVRINHAAQGTIELF